MRPLANAAIGAVVFGLAGAAAGALWIGLEFPFAVVLPAALGWLAVSWGPFGRRRALWAALVGGASFTVAFVLSLFAAIADGSPVDLPAWAAAVFSAAVAGALTGAVLDRARGAGWMALFSAAGMALGTVATLAARAIAPTGVDVPGVAQTAYFSAVQGVVGAITGAAIGYGVAWLAHRGARANERSAGVS